MTPSPDAGLDRVRLVVLDVNETLSDLSRLDEVFAEVGLPGQREAWFAGVLRDAFALTVHGELPAFADLAADGVRSRLGAGGAAAAARVLEVFGALPVHPDVVPALAALAAAGLRVATLSNGAASVAEQLLGRAGAADHVERFLSVADAGAWKPAPAAYRHALEACGVAAHEALLVAVHPWDLDGAARAGLRTAWVDREGTGLGGYPASMRSPDAVVGGLDGLPAALGR